MNIYMFISPFELIMIMLIGLAGAAMKIGFVSKSTGDDWVSELIIERRTLQSSISLDKSVIPLRFYYPPLHYFLISKFKREKRIIIGLFFNLFYDFISSVVVFAVSKWHFSLINYQNSIYLALMSMALFSFSPLLTPVHARIMGLKSRSLGTLISILYFSSLYYAIVAENFYFYYLSVFFGLMAIAASQFSYQAILFITLFIPLLSLSPSPIFVLLAIALIGLLIPAFDLKNLIKNKIAHFSWYSKTIDTTIIADRGPIRSLKLALRQREKLGALGFLNILMSANPIFIVTTSVPLLTIIVIVFLLYPDAISYILRLEELRIALIFSLAGIIVFFITSIRPFVVAGEAERYIEPIIPFINIVSFSTLHKFEFNVLEISVSIALLNIIVICINYLIIHRSEFLRLSKLESSLSPSGLHLLRQLESNSRNIGRSVKVVTAPTKLSYLFSAYSEPGSVEYLFSMGYSEEYKFDWMLDAFPDYLHLREDLVFYREKYGVDVAIIAKNIVNQARYQLILNNYPVIFQDEEFFVVSTKLR